MSEDLTKVTNSYGTEQIDSLDGLEAVRNELIQSEFVFNIENIVNTIYPHLDLILIVLSLYSIFKNRFKKPKIKLIDIDYYGNNTISNKHLQELNESERSDSNINIDLIKYIKKFYIQKIEKLKESKLKITLTLSIKNLNSIDLNIQNLKVILIDINNNIIKEIYEEKIKIENNSTFDKILIFEDIEEITFNDVKKIIISFKYNNKSFYKKIKLEKFRGI